MKMDLSSSNSSLLEELNREEDNSSLLEELNHEEAKQYIGGVVFVTLLMVTGIIGNIHVLLVYTFRIKPSNHRVFILVLGALDLTTCCVGMPFIIVDLRNPLTFTWSSPCKLLRFINYFICTSSALTLLVMAVDRYRKICVPLGRQLSRQMALAFCGIVIVISALFAWPAPVLFGASTIHTSYPDVNGVRCFTEDRFKDTKFMLYFNAVLILLVLCVFIILVVLYILIGRTISRHTTFQNNYRCKPSLSKMKQINSATETSETKETKETSETSVSGSSEGKKTPEPETSTATSKESITVNDATTTSNKQREIKQEPAVEGKAKGVDRVRRITFIFFMITTVFFMSYIPHLTLQIVTFTKNDFVSNMTFTGKVMYNTFLRCFFINNMANSIIYGFCDNRFRQELKKVYSHVFRIILCRH